MDTKQPTKKQLHMISFTADGAILAEKIRKGLEKKMSEGEQDESYQVFVEKKPFTMSLQAFTEKAFSEAEALVFVGAVGIAVRSIAPFMQSKYTDPAVVVIDEAGRYCISLLSGHVGGANALTEIIAGITGAIPIITTATDIRQCFAVDVFAKKNGLFYYPYEQGKQLAKEISAALLQGEKLCIQSDFKIIGELPEQLVRDADAGYTIAISLFPDFSFHKEQQEDKKILYLIPKLITIGIGCKKQTSLEAIENAVRESLQEVQGQESDLSKLLCSTMQIASIDIKKEEPGLLAFSEKHKIPLNTFTAAELAEARGTFQASAFVKQTVGIDNVCERAAVLGSSQGTVIRGKKAYEGVTVALAAADWSVTFA